MKRPNHSGTVYKLNGKRRRPWAASITLGYDDDGRRQRRVTTHATKKEALDEIGRYNLSPTVRPTITLKELYEEWSQSHFLRIDQDTIDGYIYAYSKIKQLQKMKFTELRTVHFQLIIDSLKLSRSVNHQIKTLVNMLYKYALENDICNKNYAEFIKMPKVRKKEKERFSETSIKKLFMHDDEHMAKLILCMIHSGFRPTAFLSLEDDCYIKYVKEYNMLVGGIKTEAGYERTVPVHEAIHDYVEYFYNLNGDVLFCRENGRRYSDLKNFRSRDYKSALERYGIKYLPPMRCRHTFSSLMAKYKVSKLAHTKVMGHTKYSMSADTYSHLEIDDLSNELNKIPVLR